MAFPSGIETFDTIYGYNPSGINIQTIYPSGEHIVLSSTKSGYLKLVPEMESPELKAFNNALQIASGKFTVITSGTPSAGQVYIDPTTGRFVFNNSEPNTNAYFFYYGYGSLVGADTYYNPVAQTLENVQEYILGDLDDRIVGIESDVSNAFDYIAEISGDFSAHIVAENPHNITTELIGAADLDYVNAEISGLTSYVDSQDASLDGKIDALSGSFAAHVSADNPHNISPSSIGAAEEVHTHDDRYYTESEIDVSLTSYATLINLATASGDIVAQIPSIVGLANESYVDSAISGVVDQLVTASGDIVDQIPDISGLATESYVDDAISDVQAQISGVTVQSPLSINANDISIEAADINTDGYLTSGDWASFDAKEPAISTSGVNYYLNGLKQWHAIDLGNVIDNNNVMASGTFIDYSGDEGEFFRSLGVVAVGWTSQKNFFGSSEAQGFINDNANGNLELNSSGVVYVAASGGVEADCSIAVTAADSNLSVTSTGKVMLDNDGDQNSYLAMSTDVNSDPAIGLFFDNRKVATFGSLPTTSEAIFYGGVGVNHDYGEHGYFYVAGYSGLHEGSIFYVDPQFGYASVYRNILVGYGDEVDGFITFEPSGWYGGDPSLSIGTYGDYAYIKADQHFSASGDHELRIYNEASGYNMDVSIYGKLLSNIDENGINYLKVQNDYNGAAAAAGIELRNDFSYTRLYYTSSSHATDPNTFFINGPSAQAAVKINSLGLHFTPQLFVSEGSETAPAICFGEDETSGFFKPASGQIGLSIAESTVVEFDSSYTKLYGQLKLPNGSFGTPSLTFDREDMTGLYSSASGAIAFQSLGGYVASLDSSGIYTNVPICPIMNNTHSVGSAGKSFGVGYINNMLLANGSAATPAVAASGDIDTGLYFSGTNAVSLAAGAIDGLTVSSTNTRSHLPLLIPDGSIGSPSLSFFGDQDTGFYSSGANAFRAVASGVYSTEFTPGTITAPSGVFNRITTGSSYISNNDGADGELTFSFIDTLALTLKEESLEPWTDLQLNLGSTSNRFQYGYITRTFVGDGSLASPSMSLQSDTNTGFYKYTNDQLGVSCGGTLSAVFYSSGLAFTNSKNILLGSNAYMTGNSSLLYFDFISVDGVSPQFRFGRSTNTGAGNLSTYWLKGDGSSQTSMYLNHFTGDLVLFLGDLTMLTGDLIISTNSTPASAGASGTKGTIKWDTSYIYICTATNTWRRVAHSTW